MTTFLYFSKKGLSIPPVLDQALRKSKINLISEEDLGRTEKPSAVLVLGGDGTLLRAVPFAYRLDLPIIGINLGKFGFLTKLTLDEALHLIENWGKAELYFDERDLLEIKYKGRNYHALNEGAILKGPTGRSIKLDVYIEEEVYEVYGDGLLVATPTGSTAYNLSAGGPIVHPGSQVLLITPICPFKVQLRPIVIPMDFKVRIELPSVEDEVHFLIDGHTNLLLEEREAIEFKRAPRKIKLIRDPRKGFLIILREKFGW